jgi:RNA polymerase sigma-70 factor (ECF subfamily)
VSRPVPADAGALLDVYDRALPEVYGYLRHRCGDRLEAEDLTAETFVAAARSIDAGTAGVVSIPWLIGVARHKLIDHWRARARDERTVAALAVPPAPADPSDERLDALRAVEVLRSLSASHRAALSLRYLDDLPVKEVAELLGRTEGATDQLLVRARAAFRRAYAGGDHGD